MEHEIIYLSFMIDIHKYISYFRFNLTKNLREQLLATVRINNKEILAYYYDQPHQSFTRITPGVQIPVNDKILSAIYE